jgi:hypothetical protein|tara:strand:- start:1017 stop:1337 length:321 start_codon:yes stop_codon:yes gene_type:complete
LATTNVPSATQSKSQALELKSPSPATQSTTGSGARLKIFEDFFFDLFLGYRREEEKKRTNNLCVRALQQEDRGRRSKEEERNKERRNVRVFSSPSRTRRSVCTRRT